MSSISEFIHNNLVKYINLSNYAEYIEKPDNECCKKCGRVEDLYVRGSGKNKECLCSACMFFVVQLENHDETKQITIKQKDTLMIITPRMTKIVGDVSQKIFDKKKVKVINSAQLQKEKGYTWRNILAKYVLSEHKKKEEPALVIFQSKADQMDTFEISYGPDYVSLCGQFHERINVRRMQLAEKLVKDIPTTKWQEAIKLSYFNEFERIGEENRKKLDKYKEKYPQLFTSEALECLPLFRSTEFYLLGWALK